MTTPAPDTETGTEPEVDAMDDAYATIPPPPEDEGSSDADAQGDATGADLDPVPENGPAPSTPVADPVDPVAAAQRVIAEFEQAQAQACATELEAVLTRYGMRLEVSPAQITLVPADKG